MLPNFKTNLRGLQYHISLWSSITNGTKSKYFLSKRILIFRSVKDNPNDTVAPILYLLILYWSVVGTRLTDFCSGLW